VESIVAPILHAAVSDVGRVRRENQDAFGEFSSAAGERLFVVADGMGGHRGGSTASRLCVETIGHAFEGLEPAETRLRRGFALANARIHEVAEADPELIGMGTTAVAVALGPDGSAALAWVGDSRVYRLRDGTLEQLSSDHSIVGEMIRSGVLTPEGAESHPRRNELMRAIGPLPSVEAETRVLRHAPGDRFLLCTDGLWGPVPVAELAEVLGDETPELAVAKLVARANARGGPDNVTALVACVDGGATSAGARIARPWTKFAVGAALVAALLALATLLLA
jgi:protein phosphatase